MIFILLYIPCVSTVAAIRKETYSWKWTALAVAYPLVTAYVLTFIFIKLDIYLFKEWLKCQSLLIF